jgi:aspartate carbamoyltransferase catalytic subunit
MKKWIRKSLLGLDGLAEWEIRKVIETAELLNSKKVKGNSIQSLLNGKRVINLFMEPSTRTRVAFEIAAKSLGADVITINAKASSLTKGESLRDTALNVRALGADVIIIRHSAPGSPLFLSNIVDVPIINAGDGAHEHPSQGLLDIYTLIQKFGDLKNKRITILGDILFSRVARSNLFGLLTMGAKVTLAGPSTLVPKEFEKLGANVSHNLKDALTGADAVMLLRIQHERQSTKHFPTLGEYSNMFGLNNSTLKYIKNDAVILHPGPINRGIEIDSSIADSKRSLILNQVKNGIAVRMAILKLCTSIN